MKPQAELPSPLTISWHLPMRLPRLPHSLLLAGRGFCCLLLLSSVGLAQEAKTAVAVAEEKAAPEDAATVDEVTLSYKVSSVVQQASATIAGEVMEYQVETGTLTQATDTGEEKAKMFFVAYTKPGADESRRPITFAFNGGPGSSSVWLHLGMLGPKRIEFPNDASFMRPPYHLDANPHSLLDVSDLVFIDPVSTGFSRVVGDEEKSNFHGYNEDVRSVAQFIHDWLSHKSRWESPKFVLGESYGGLRAAGLAGYLQSRYNIELNGAVVISGAINFQTLRFGNGNDLPYICFLPTYAATAWYHQVLSEEMQQLPVEQVVQRAEQLAVGGYADVLLLGAQAKAGRVKKVVAEMSALTGLSEEYIQRSNLRVSMSRFGKELLRKTDKTIGRFDSRFTGFDSDAAGATTEYDPSGAAIFGPFTATMNQYLREDLKYEQPRTYEILTGNVQPWNYDSFTGRYVDGSESLRSAMTGNPHFKLFVACGYYDLATPHFAMDYTLNHLGLDSSLRKNITVETYEGGHMMYIYEPAMQRLRENLVAWYAEADGLD